MEVRVTDRSPYDDEDVETLTREVSPGGNQVPTRYLVLRTRNTRSSVDLLDD